MPADAHQNPGESTTDESRLLLEMRRDQAAAGLMQKRMLPSTPLRFGEFTLTYEMYPATDLSGDFVDFFQLPDSSVVFIVADVAGHGSAAALVTVLLKSFMSRLAATNLCRPADMLSALNSELLAVDLERHVCVLCGVVSRENRLSLASAGAFPLPLLTPNNAKPTQPAEAINLKGRALGLFEDESFEQVEILMNPGDRLTVVTDGVLEVIAADGLSAKETLLAKAASQSRAAGFWQELAVVPDAETLDDISRLCLWRSL